MLYCLHSNRKYSYFRKSKLHIQSKKIKEIKSQKKLTEHEKLVIIYFIKKCFVDLGTKLRGDIFRDYPIQHDGTAKAFDVLCFEMIERYSKLDIAEFGKKICRMKPGFYKTKQGFDKFMQRGDREEESKEISELITQLVKLDTPSKKVALFVTKFLRKILPVKMFGLYNLNKVRN